MSRGGRGGFGGGRGNELKGASWAHDPTVKLESKPSELFPVSLPELNIVENTEGV